MKLFMLLSTVAVTEAALSAAQETAAKQAFNKWDVDHKGNLASGGVYGALSTLDKNLTEEQLQKAAGQKKSVNLKQFLQIFSTVEGGDKKSKYPKGCKNWFDGCNHCIIKNGKELGCTEMFCSEHFDAPKKKAFCTVYEDGRRCKSATDCSKTQQYNCFTREVWSAAKKAYCCKTRKMGCPTNTKKGLKAGDVCYAFYENNADAKNVNRKNDCPKGYKCASDPSLIGFDSIMRCVKASGGASTGIPAGCTSWFDGCNTCMVRDGQKLGCTKRFCFANGTPSCKQFGSDVVVHAED